MQRTSDAELAALLTADLTRLPLEVLVSLRSGANAEIVRRRREGRIADVEAREAADKLRTLGKHPNARQQYNRHWLSYLDSLLQQDWSHLFSGGDPEPRFYVYAHIRPSGKNVRFVGHGVSMRLPGLPFYIGKGTGDRAFDLKRNQGHGALLRELVDGGRTPLDIAHIVADKLPEAKALEIESKLIYFFGTKYEPGRRGLLVNLDIPPRPPGY